MDISPGRELVTKHWKLITAVAVACALVAFTASFLWSPKYSATTHVLVVAREARFLNAQGQQQPYDPVVVSSLDDTYSEFLTSRELAQAVVTDLHLDKRKGDASLFAKVRSGLKKVENVTIAILEHGFYAEASANDGAVAQVQGNILATPIKDSLVIEIKASADDPKLAAAIANTASQELINSVRDRDQQNADIYLTFLKGEVDKLSAAVATATDNVRQYKLANHLSDVQVQQILTSQSNKSLADQLTTTDINLASAKAEYDALQKSMARITTTDSTTSTIQTGRSTTTLTNSASSGVYQNLQAQAASTSAQIASLQAQHDTITALLEPTTSVLPTQQATLYQLEFKLSAAQGAFTSVQDSYQSQLITSSSTPQELSIVDSASPPIYPDSPLRYLYLVIGLLVGAAGGAGLAYFTDRRKAPANVIDSKIRRPQLAPQAVRAFNRYPAIHAVDDDPFDSEIAE
jgi:succinoglycan biosynthesis transport protein ExoP